MPRYYKFGLLLVALMTGACQVGPVDPETTEYYRIPVGSTVTLHTALSVPPEKATIYIQDGELKAYRDIRRYYPHCSLEVKTLSQEVQVIQPDVFTIERSYFWEQTRAPATTFHYTRRIFGGDNSPTYIEMQRVMYLHSLQQPDVFRLTCLYWATGPIYDHLIIREVRQTLGNLMTLQLLSHSTI